MGSRNKGLLFLITPILTSRFSDFRPESESRGWSKGAGKKETQASFGAEALTDFR
jgi:hypothetical protein